MGTVRGPRVFSREIAVGCSGDEIRAVRRGESEGVGQKTDRFGPWRGTTAALKRANGIRADPGTLSKRFLRQSGEAATVPQQFPKWDRPSHG